MAKKKVNENVVNQTKKCQTCNSKRLVFISGKSSDMNSFYFEESGKKSDDFEYVPDDMNIGGGDYIEFFMCLDCGQIQGDFPLKKTKLEKNLK